MFVHSPNSYVGILTTEEMVLGSEAFGRCLTHKCGAFMNGISVLLREVPEGSFAHSSVMRGYNEKSTVLKMFLT